MQWGRIRIIAFAVHCIAIIAMIVAPWFQAYVRVVKLQKQKILWKCDDVDPSSCRNRNICTRIVDARKVWQTHSVAGRLLRREDMRRRTSSQQSLVGTCDRNCMAASNTLCAYSIILCMYSFERRTHTNAIRLPFVAYGESESTPRETAEIPENVCNIRRACTAHKRSLISANLPFVASATFSPENSTFDSRLSCDQLVSQ